MYSLYETAIREENTFLAKMVEKYGDDPSITRHEIGYSQYTTNLVDQGVLIIVDEGIVEMNVTYRGYGPMVSSRGLVRIGDEIRQYSYDWIKIIFDGDYTKVKDLGNLRESKGNIHVSEVERTLAPIAVNGKMNELIGSCDNIVDKYKLIAYEGLTRTDEGGWPCANWMNTHDITLRSLKKVLGTWQNYSTNFLSITVTLNLDHLNCDFTFNSDVTYLTGAHWVTSPGTHHTYTWATLYRYNTGPCTNTSPNCNGQPGSVQFAPGTAHVIQAFGYNGTTCYTSNFP